jgi:hypothetical protein
MAGTTEPSPKPEEIDALLDQVEKKFLKSPEAIKLSETSPKDCPCTTKHATDWKEVDEMLKDFKLLDDNNIKSKSKNVNKSRDDDPAVQKELEEHHETKKCFNVYLSGSFETMGCSVLGGEKYELNNYYIFNN